MNILTKARKYIRDLWSFVQDVWDACFWDSADMDEEWLVDDFDEDFEYEAEEDVPTA